MIASERQKAIDAAWTTVTKAVDAATTTGVDAENLKTLRDAFINRQLAETATEIRNPGWWSEAAHGQRIYTAVQPTGLVELTSTTESLTTAELAKFAKTDASSEPSAVVATPPAQGTAVAMAAVAGSESSASKRTDTEEAGTTVPDTFTQLGVDAVRQQRSYILRTLQAAIPVAIHPVAVSPTADDFISMIAAARKALGAEADIAPLILVLPPAVLGDDEKRVKRVLGGGELIPAATSVNAAFVFAAQPRGAVWYSAVDFSVGWKEHGDDDVKISVASRVLMDISVDLRMYRAPLAPA